MNKTWWVLALPLALLPLAFAHACGGSSPMMMTTTTSTTTTLITTTSTASMTTSSTTFVTTTSTTTVVTNACVDNSDETATMKAAFPNDVSSCTLSNVTSGASKIAQCLETTDGLSAACAGCFANYGVCGAQNCLAQCTGAQGAADPACRACIASHCGAALKTCSGLTITPPTDGGAPADGGADLTP